jgi:multidrug transporter EmrE-like cation transporter
MSLQLLFGMSLTEIIGDFAFKEYANKGGILPLTIGIVGYIGVCSLLIINLQGSTVLMVNAGWDAISALIESLAAIIILGERFSYYFQYIGVFFIVLGLYLLKIPLKKEHPFYILPL